MKRVAALVLFLVGFVLPAAAGEYSYENRPTVVYPTPNGGNAHISPFPMSKRAAAVWASDACWSDCTGRCAWRMEACVATANADQCRPRLQACDLACQKQCRTRGGPLLNITD